MLMSHHCRLPVRLLQPNDGSLGGGAGDGTPSVSQKSKGREPLAMR